MSDDPEEPEYRVYRGGKPSTPAGRRPRPAQAAPPPPAQAPPPRPPRQRPPDPPAGDSGYRVYRSQPRGVAARLRGETDSEIGSRLEESERAGALRRDGSLRRGNSNRDGRGGLNGSGGRDGFGGRGGRGGSGDVGVAPQGLGRWGRGTWTIRRALKYLVSLIVLWVLFSGVLFVISASEKAGKIPHSLSAALSKTSAPMLLSAQNVLVLGLDNRPTGTHEAGANTSEALANTDSIMIWRVGGGVSRKLSIPRDTLVNIPGLGEAKINAAWAHGSDGEGTTVKVVESLTGIKINHVIVVDLANFPKFIDDVGGVTVKTGRICSNISGGASQGGFTLNLKPGTHHLDGQEALTLARTRDNTCNLAYDDIQREEAQQEILNSIKSQLFSVHAFFHLPWVAWDAPGVIQTDMGAATLLQMFASAEIGGSPQPETLTETGETYNGEDVLVPNSANVRAKVDQLMTGK